LTATRLMLEKYPVGLMIVHLPQRDPVMAIARAKIAPGAGDITAEFSKQNIRQTLKDYKALRSSTGDYQFGAITAKHYNLDPGELKAWQAECADYPTDVQDEIKRTVIYALNNTDDNGNDAPIPITFKWVGGSAGVSTAYIPYGQKDGPSYTITISGYPPPVSSSLSERRAKSKSR